MDIERFKRIQTPKELRKLSPDLLKYFSDELRKEIIKTLSTGEGHLGSSLGVVELSVALHYCFDTPFDVLIWDVGHQAYVHKMLTGRRSSFKSIRKKNGISGFPKREESEYDTFGTGHAGTAISAVLGMAISAKLQNKKRHHIAIVGDASIVNGMAFEALNHLGTTKANVLIILNDNSMGIDPSVGALKNYLTDIKKENSKVPDFFQSLNVKYEGPIDGHNLESLISSFQRQKKKSGPRILHVVTTKGKGLLPAEKEKVIYHAPGKFDPVTGKLNPSPEHKKIKFQNILGETLLNLAKKNKKIIAITPAMPTGSGLVNMMNKLPNQCIDVGIAEQHAVTLSAGMATQGMIPFCVIYSTFLQRAYDQIIHDVALQKLPVIFCIDRAGIVGHDGPTHHGVFDIAYLRGIPNIQIVAPRNAKILQNLIYTVQLGIKSPLAIRYPRGFSELNEISFDFKKIKWGQGKQLKKGDTIAILTIGTLAEKIDLAMLKVENSKAFAHFDLCFIKPLDEVLLHKIFKTYKAVIVFEEGIKKGGVGSAVLEFAAQHGYSIPINTEGIDDQFVSHGKTYDLLNEIGLDAETISNKLNLLLNKLSG
ncbi:MAG: 1-deoxy-D-xylulose-5-phosphate synthase [Flavobacteriaceae bacterium]